MRHAAARLRHALVCLALAAPALGACTAADSTGWLESRLQTLRGLNDSLLRRKAEAELELVRESEAAARILAEEAARIGRAKCHAGLPALIAWAERGPANRAALAADCGLQVAPGRARLSPP